MGKSLALASAIFVAALLVSTPAASAKKPQLTAGSATLTASYDAGTQHLSIAGCGYAVAPVQVIYTHPDATTETWYTGMFGDGCLDNNYILASESGTWTIDVYQGGALVASASVGLP